MTTRLASLFGLRSKRVPTAQTAVEIDFFDDIRLCQLLDRRRRNVVVDADGDFVISAPSDGKALPVVVTAAAEGMDRDIFTVRVTSTVGYPPERTEALLRAMNDWHGSSRWPTGYLLHVPPDVDGRADDENGLIFVTAAVHLNLATGVHDALLDALFDEAVRACLDFARAMHRVAGK